MAEHKENLVARLVSPVVVVCHDAGAANLIFAWLRDWAASNLLNDHEFRLVLKGPAELAWRNQNLALRHTQIYTELSTALQGANCVLTGTGWASSLEHDARKLASTQQIPCAAVIDHWVNYPQRFERGAEVVLPDEIWVADTYAAEIAGRLFKGIRVLELSNAYLQEQVKNIPEIPDGSRTLLYVLEPLRMDWGRGKPGEFQALDFFAQHLQLIVGHQPVQVMLRPHPSDPPHKYDDWINAHPNLSLTLDQNPSLSQAIGRARWVVGAETFAMVVANAAGRPTYSSLPPWAHTCRLPHQEIVHLSDLI